MDRRPHSKTSVLSPFFSTFSTSLFSPFRIPTSQFCHLPSVLCLHAMPSAPCSLLTLSPFPIPTSNFYSLSPDPYFQLSALSLQPFSPFRIPHSHFPGPDRVYKVSVYKLVGNLFHQNQGFILESRQGGPNSVFCLLPPMNKIYRSLNGFFHHLCQLVCNG